MNTRRCRPMRSAHIVLAATLGWALPAQAALMPATFEEGVGIGIFSVSGASLADAETVSLTVLSRDFDHRGSGTGQARADALLPVAAEATLHLNGDVNISGIGGTAYVETRYQFAIEALGPGLPNQVPILIDAFGSVFVSSNRPVGESFARITTPFGQWQVANYDAFGQYTGLWEQGWAIPGLTGVGTPYGIVLYARTHGQASGPGYGPDYFFDSRAFIDPVVRIDPGFALRDQYRVVYSDGVGLVPEAPPLALFAVGIAGLLGWRRRAGAAAKART